MLKQINKDTVLCISIAARPGTFGMRFHNYLYRQLDLNFLYKSFAVQDLYSAIQGIKGLGIRGSAITMPFKEEVLRYLDFIDDNALRIGAVNTVVNDQGKLTGYNTDYLAVKELIQVAEIPFSSSVAILGSGGMARAIVTAFHDLGFKQCTLISRNPHTGGSLAEKYAYRWLPQFDGAGYEVLVNATPIGMGGANPDEIPFSKERVQSAKFIIDSVGSPPETPLVRLGKQLNKVTIAGYQISEIQAQEQFRLYTGITPPQHLVKEAAEWARG